MTGAIGPVEPAGDRPTAQVELDGTVHTVPRPAGTPCSTPSSPPDSWPRTPAGRAPAAPAADLTEGYTLACQALRLGDDRMRITQEG